MPFQKTTAIEKITKLRKRLRIIQGGTSAGKTIAILLYLIDYAQSHNNKLISVVSETFPHLKRGAIRDFINIMTEQNYFQDSNWNKTDCIYTFETKSQIEFFSADQPAKVRGPRRNVLFINEANSVPYDTYTQLVLRTDELIFVDYNPVSSFYIHEEVMPITDHDFLILTYKDNEGLPESVINEIESRKHNKNFWTVYGLGEVGNLEGKIYNDWQILDEVPHEARLERRGLDYGYSIDPSALVDIYYMDGGYILDEQLYQKGMSNKRLADFILSLYEPHVLVIADSAEPKSIDEMYSYGVNIRGAEKGKDSVRQGIQYVQDLKISVTKRSVNLIKEYRNYVWAVDRLGQIISPNIPIDYFDHCMSAVRYALCSLEHKDPAREAYRQAAYYEQRQERRKQISSKYGV